MITNPIPGKFRVAVVGSREMTDENIVFNYLTKHQEKIGMIISGGARGVDSLAAKFCKERAIPLLEFYPKWYDDNGSFDKGAGFRRNIDIVREADVVVVFHKNKSRGSQHSIDLAKRYGKILKVIECQ